MKNIPRAKIAYNKLLHSIVTGEKLPGSRLIPADLESELNIGRVPIREALFELGQTGLVVLEPYKGAIVATPPTMEEIQEIFEIRYMLEGKAAEVAASKLKNVVIEEMERLHAEMSRHPHNGEPYFQLNRKFHLTLYDASDLNHLCHIIRQLIDKVATFRIRYPFEIVDYRRFNREHAEIIELLKKGEGRRIKEKIVANVRSGFETLVKVYAKMSP
jgi:DNA-binding GntR family transcriptional regulator